MKFHALKWHIQHAKEDKVHFIKYLANQKLHFFILREKKQHGAH